MVNLTVLCVGKLKESYWRAACDEYVKRLSAFCRIEVVEVAEERAPADPSPAQLAQVVEAEGQRLLQKLPPDAAVLALCVEGETCDSPTLARRLSRLAVDGINRAVLVIGGSWGLSEELKRRARWRLSMSPMTFPHQLARVMVLEQLYRAAQIESGGRYHK